MNKLRDISKHLLLRFRVVTILSVSSHILTCILFWISMIFYQAYPVTSDRSTYMVCSGLFVWSIAKSSMYFLFLDRLYTTFNSSAYRINKRLVIFVMTLISVNFLNYMNIVFWFYQYRQNEENLTAFYFGTASFLIEIVFSTIIVQQFAIKLFRVRFYLFVYLYLSLETLIITVGKSWPYK